MVFTLFPKLLTRGCLQQLLVASITGWPVVSRNEVFLRVEYARRNLIQLLYESLTASGIHAFIDHDGIEIGEEITPKIFEVIAHTEICIP